MSCRKVVQGVLEPKCDILDKSDLELSALDLQSWGTINCRIVVLGVLQPRCGNLPNSDLELISRLEKVNCRTVVQGVPQPKLRSGLLSLQT